VLDARRSHGTGYALFSHSKEQVNRANEMGDQLPHHKYELDIQDWEDLDRPEELMISFEVPDNE